MLTKHKRLQGGIGGGEHLGVATSVMTIYDQGHKVYALEKELSVVLNLFFCLPRAREHEQK